MMTFGERFMYWRQGNALSQEDVARQLNCSRRTIGLWEKGKMLPSYDCIIAVAIMMDVSTDWLLGMNDYRRAAK